MNTETQYHDEVRWSQTPGKRWPKRVERDSGKDPCPRKGGPWNSEGDVIWAEFERRQERSYADTWASQWWQGQSPEWSWQLKGQGVWNKEWIVRGEFQPCQEVISLMCAQKKVENLAWDTRKRFQSRGNTELCLEQWTRDISLPGDIGVRAPFYLESATLVFSVKKLRVLREEKKVWGVWQRFTKRRKNARREMEGKLIWLPRVFYAGCKVLDFWMNCKPLTHIWQKERGGRWEVQEGRSAWRWQRDEDCVCSEWDSKMKPQWGCLRASSS